MNRETRIWLTVMSVGAAMLLLRAAIVGNGRQYVQEVQTAIEVDGQTTTLTSFQNVDPRQRSEAGVSLSVPRTIGLWVAALCTIGILSFLAGDTPLYKLVESIFV